jgi:DNA-binding IclR family transcriptional regulator
MRNGTPTIASLARALTTLEALISANGARSLSDVARDLSIPIATVHRQASTLVSEGFLVRLANGHYSAGARLARLLGHVDEKQIIANAAAPVLHRLATRLRCVVQLGTFEDEMVTYRIKTGQGAGDLFTKVGMQLEAYCSGIGKVLLAHLPKKAQEEYLAAGPFPALTPHTIVDPEGLRSALRQARLHGFATDDGEIHDGIFCVAVPVRTPDDRAPAAISVTRTTRPGRRMTTERTVQYLEEAAREIAASAFA